MEIQVGDILVMKKPHPCGASRWLVLRTGADLRLRCTGCGHEVMKPRFQILPRVRSVKRGEAGLTRCRGGAARTSRR